MIMKHLLPHMTLLFLTSTAESSKTIQVNEDNYARAEVHNRNWEMLLANTAMSLEGEIQVNEDNYARAEANNRNWDMLLANTATSLEDKIELIVNEDNYARAEVHHQMKLIIDSIEKKNQKISNGVGIFLHKPKMTDPEDQSIPRPNFDTLLSVAVIDLTTPATLIMPDTNDRYQSVIIYNEEHLVNKYFYKPGNYTLNQRELDSRYVVAIGRTMANPDDLNDLKEGKHIQQGLHIQQAEKGNFSPTEKFDAYSLTKMTEQLRKEFFYLDPQPTSGEMYGSKKDKLSQENINYGVAVGVFGNPPSIVVYVDNDKEPGFTGPYKLNLTDVPVNAFWSVTVYNPDGFIEHVNATYNTNSEKVVYEKDSKSVIINFVDYQATGVRLPNVLHTYPGWTYVIRLYEATEAYQDGSWKVPKLEAVEIDSGLNEIECEEMGADYQGKCLCERFEGDTNCDMMYSEDRCNKISICNWSFGKCNFRPCEDLTEEECNMSIDCKYAITSKKIKECVEANGRLMNYYLGGVKKKIHEKIGGDEVDETNYARAEVHRQFKLTLTKVDVGVFGHKPNMTDPNDKSIPRPNFDTLYSGAIIDLTTPATLIMPETNGRYQSVVIFNEEHLINKFFLEAGNYTLTEKELGTKYVIALGRTLANPKDPEDFAEGKRVQHGLRLEQAVKGCFSPPEKFDGNSLEEMSKKLRKEFFYLDPQPTSGEMYGSKKDKLSQENINYGVAVGVFGNPPQRAVYINNDRVPGFTGPYKLTLTDVPVNAFWSVTVYNPDGFIEHVNANYNTNSEKVVYEDKYKKTAIINFVDYQATEVKLPNVLHTYPGWSYVIRLYEASDEYFKKKWEEPQLEAVEIDSELSETECMEIGAEFMGSDLEDKCVRFEGDAEALCNKIISETECNNTNTCYWTPPCTCNFLSCDLIPTEYQCDMSPDCKYSRTTYECVDIHGAREEYMNKTKVVGENYARAELHRQFKMITMNIGKNQGNNGVGVFGHRVNMTDPEDKSIPRPNFDTLYSAAVINLRYNATIIMPETNGRYQSMTIFNEEHLINKFCLRPGNCTLSREELGTWYVYALARTLANPEDPEDLAEGRRVQRRLRIEQAVKGDFSPPEKFDGMSLMRKTEKLKDRFKTMDPQPTSGEMYGSKDDNLTQENINMGVAVGVFGNPPQRAVYLNNDKEPGFTGPYLLNLTDVPVNAFWSVTIYNPDGLIEHVNVNYNTNSEKCEYTDEYKRTAIINFVDFQATEVKLPNVLHTYPGWSYVIRLYEASDEFYDKSWEVPQLEVLPLPIELGQSECEEMGGAYQGECMCERYEGDAEPLCNSITYPDLCKNTNTCLWSSDKCVYRSCDLIPTEEECNGTIECKYTRRSNECVEILGRRKSQFMGIQKKMMKSMGVGEGNIKVNETNYVRAELHRQFKMIAMMIGNKTGTSGTGIFGHRPNMTDPEDKSIPRPNFDTLYSAAVIDLTYNATIIMPETNGRYQSLMIFNEEHLINKFCLRPGDCTLSQEELGTKYVYTLARTLANPEDPLDLDEGRRVQKELRIEQAVRGCFSPPEKFNGDSLEAMTEHLKYEFNHLDPQPTSGEMYGSKDDNLTQKNINYGVAVGVFGNPPQRAVYINNDKEPGFTGPYLLNLTDVPVNAFWSVTVYNPDGLIQEVNANYNTNSEKCEYTDEYKRTAIINFVDFQATEVKLPNVLHTYPGWSYVIRLYEASDEFYDKSWRVPQLEAVDLGTDLNETECVEKGGDFEENNCQSFEGNATYLCNTIISEVQCNNTHTCSWTPPCTCDFRTCDQILTEEECNGTVDCKFLKNETCVNGNGMMVVAYKKAMKGIVNETDEYEYL